MAERQLPPQTWPVQHRHWSGLQHAGGGWSLQARDPAQALRAVTAPEVVLDAGTWLYVRLRPLDGTSRFSRGQPALRGIAHALGWGQIHLLLKSDAGGTSWVAMRAAVWAGAMANP